jgi:nitroreductase
MPHAPAITDLIRQRYSCRTYDNRPIGLDRRRPLEEYMRLIGNGPLGSPLRFRLLAAGEEDREALRGLTTYGLIRGATGFVLGAVGAAERDMEDFGYAGEQIVLLATGLGLGTCWLGGTFGRSRFAERLGLRPEERMPCAVAVGIPAGRRGLIDRVTRLGAGSDRRLPWQRLFFEGDWDTPLDEEAAGAYRTPLEMVRLAPSASNRQPWRVLRQGQAWHFCLQRTPGYHRVSEPMSGGSDLQRVDIGIAMCHFELTARELGLEGRWAPAGADVTGLGSAEHVVSWLPA